MEAIWQDIRIAARRLARNRGFTAIAIITLGLGIGANSAIFSLVNAVLLRPLPFADQDRLVVVYEHNLQGQSTVSGHEFAAWRDAKHVLQGITMYRGFGMTLTGRGDAASVQILRVTASFFDVVGIRAVIGRGFAVGEDSAGSNRVAVISHGYWEQRFNADSTIVGQDVLLDNNAYRVVGVMPPSGEFDPEIWIPVDMAEEVRAVGRHALVVIARLKPDVTFARAEAELNTISERLEREMPDMNTGHRATLVSVYDDVVGDSRRAVFVVLGAVGFVLLIACANVAHLLLTRAAGRRREVAICAAVGASRGRLISQLLSESVLLSLAGGVVGLFLAVWLVALIPSIPAVAIPRIAEVRVDAVAIAATFILSLLTGLASGLIPAFRASRTSLTESLGAGARTSAATGGRVADILVISEVALAMVLLVGAGLMLKSFAKLTSVNPGFDPDNTLVFSTALSGPGYAQPGRQRDAFTAITERLVALPGVKAVGGTTEVPLAMCCNGIMIAIEGQPPQPPGQEHSALLRTVGGDYFTAMGIPLREGRYFSQGDARIAVPLIRWWEGQPYPARFNEPQPAPMAVINEAMAKRYWPEGNALGKRFRIIASPWVTVVGIVGDVRHRGLGTPTSPEIYLSQLQEPRADLSIVVRTSDDPNALVSAIRGELRAFDKNLPIGQMQTMGAIVHNSVGRPRFNAFALGAFSVLALTLALVGIYGVISNAVTMRTKEIGIRAALGANARQVMRLILGRAGFLTASGLAIGLAIAFAMSRLIRELLFDVTPTDPATFALIAFLLGGASLLASYIPARRALRIDPLVALRND